MADDKYTFEAARIRLEEIAAEVRKKDTSLEKSLDLLEEGVRLANICTELVDHTDVGATVTSPDPEATAGDAEGDQDAADDGVAAGGAPAEARVEVPDAVSDAADSDATDDSTDGFDDADDSVDEPADQGTED